MNLILNWDMRNVYIGVWGALWLAFHLQRLITFSYFAASLAQIKPIHIKVFIIIHFTLFVDDIEINFGKNLIYFSITHR